MWSDVPIHYLLIISIDVVIILMLFIILLRSRSNNDGFNQSDITQIKNLKSSFEHTMKESEIISNQLLDMFDKRIRSLNEVHKKIYRKEKRLEDNIARAEDLIKLIDEKYQKHTDRVTDPYKKVLELMSQGLSFEEIQRQSGLSHSEIDLIKQLGRLNTSPP